MSISNRNWLVNRNTKSRDGGKIHRKSKTYWNVSCPRCGDPKSVGSKSINCFGATSSKKLKCLKCGKPIKSDK